MESLFNGGLPVVSLVIDQLDITDKCVAGLVCFQKTKITVRRAPNERGS